MRQWRAALCLEDPREASGWKDLVARRQLSAEVELEWSRWSWADDDECPVVIEIYTDGSAILSEGWPQKVTSAAWAAVVVAVTPCGGR